ncbi:hypothetical protein GGR51DRAFT_555015 [Nemania sp. FL0031]|nr:hypothetical protein GGR51DRAFT_555015 [Nemania sp. FL0031]
MLSLTTLVLALLSVPRFQLYLLITGAPRFTFLPANLTWEGRLTEDGPIVSFTGKSVADIIAQVEEVAPDFVWPDNFILVRESHGTPPESQPPPLRSEKETKRSEHRILCDQVTSGYANFHHVLDQAAQLQAMPGFCRVPPTLKGEPYLCTRMTCAEGSAIFLCNHGHDHDSVSTCARVGQYAQEIIEWCYDGASSDVKGQIYDGDNWSVMVHVDTC